MEAELHPDIERIWFKGTEYTIALDVATTLVMRQEKVHNYTTPVHNIHGPFANCSSRNWLNELMNNALLSPCLHFVQARYIIRVVITQMRRSEGY